MSSVQFTEVAAKTDWDLAKLQKNSKVFNNYLRSSVAKVAGTTRYYNRNLLKPIAVADGEMFRIKVGLSKKTDEDLKIKYTVTAPDGTVVILIDNVAFKTKDEVIVAFDEVDEDFAKIEVAE